MTCPECDGTFTPRTGALTAVCEECNSHLRWDFEASAWGIMGQRNNPKPQPKVTRLSAVKDWLRDAGIMPPVKQPERLTFELVGTRAMYPCKECSTPVLPHLALHGQWIIGRSKVTQIKFNPKTVEYEEVSRIIPKIARGYLCPACRMAKGQAWERSPEPKLLVSGRFDQ